ncbi:XRE family transcriptional regulator [Mesorhizobium sp. NZP2234]|nr:XRE family transcriptional regulator [Mesorhizobium sp. NZP2234]
MVGRNARRIRKKAGFTQKQLAEISGFSQQYISGLKKGKRNPTIVTPSASAISIWCDLTDQGLSAIGDGADAPRTFRQPYPSCR